MDADTTFVAPGPGSWELDRSHYPGGTTPISQWLMETSSEAAFRRLFGEFGVPADTLEFRFVHGFLYSRLRPLVGANKTSAKAPPALAVKLLTRLHPEFRRRTRSAQRLQHERPWREMCLRWQAEIRPELERVNLAHQDVDLVSLDDAELADELAARLAHCRTTFEQHFYLHGFDLGPIGMLMLDCREEWNLSTAEVVPALVGASPSTSGPARTAARIRAALAETGSRPTTLDELRAVSPVVRELVDDYVRLRGHMVYGRYDLDGPTLQEAPDVLLATFVRGTTLAPHRPELAEAVAAELRERVPAADRASFDERLREARAAMDLRDDNGPNTIEWPIGLLRGAMLEAARRLSERGRLARAEHIFDVRADELATLMSTGAGPSAEQLSERAETRRHQATLSPPQRLGPLAAPPPLSAMPAALARNVAMVEAVIAELGMSGSPEPQATASVTGGRRELRGVGVGRSTYRGRARLALSAEQAIATLEPGDILVTRTTTPAFNLVLSLAGGVVTADGGPLCHAAVLARELDIPAIVGAVGVLEQLVDGDEIELDPVAGVVRCLAAR